MSNIFGQLNLNDTDRVFNATTGQEAVYEIIEQYNARYNQELNAAKAVFVGDMSDIHKLRYKLPANGRLQRRGRSSTPANRKNSGYWDVAFPLEDFGDTVAGDDVTLGYMTALELSNHVTGVMTRDKSTVRHEILRALFNNAQDTFSDPLWGNLSIEPLANGDGVVYPPVLGSDTEATDDHYLVSGYASTDISDTNDPFATLVEELIEHFGESVGGDNIVTFINQGQLAKVAALADYEAVPDNFIRSGDNTNIPQRLPNVPGRIVGRMTGGDNATWVSVWRWIPANYMLTIHLEEAQPIQERVDPADTGLGNGLVLVSESGTKPVNQWFWRHRFGFGASNRLNGAVMQLKASGSYDVPSAYS